MFYFRQVAQLLLPVFATDGAQALHIGHGWATPGADAMPKPPLIGLIADRRGGLGDVRLFWPRSRAVSGPESRMLDLLDREPTRPEDRALFGLQERPVPQAQPSSDAGTFDGAW